MYITTVPDHTIITGIGEGAEAALADHHREMEKIGEKGLEPYATYPAGARLARAVLEIGGGPDYSWAIRQGVADLLD